MLTEPTPDMPFHDAREEKTSAAPEEPFPTILLGRFMREDKTEHACRLKNLTPEQAMLVTEEELKAGERIVAYVDDAGRLEGTVIPLEEKGHYRFRLQLSQAGREKLKCRIDWIQARQRGDAARKRRHERYRPRNSRSQIVLEDGRRYDCDIIDISISGASVRCPVLPAIEALVMLGKTRGRVVRHHSQGFAIEFLHYLPMKALRSNFI